jgi:HEPN domain-containing protein
MSKETLDNTITQLLKECTLDGRLRTHFVFKWFDENTIPDRYHTEEEGYLASNYAKEETNKILEIVEEWINDKSELR